LPATDKLAVQAASVLGQRFSLDALRNLIDDSRYDCAELVTHHLIREQDEGYLFDHALVRDGVYGSLLRSRRNALHLKAAAWFAASDLPLRAEHLEQAGHPDAAEAFFDAAHAQWTALRLDHACRLAERGLALEAGPETVFELNCLHGELLRELGEPERSIKAFSEALAVQAGDTQKCRALLGIAEGMRIVERIDDALGLLAETQPLAEAEGMTEALMRLHHLRGNLLFPKGDIAGCEAGHRESIRYAKEIGAAEGEARGLGGLGDAAYVAGRMRTSHDMLSRCVELCREHGYRRTEVANAAQVCHTKLYKLEIREALAQGRATIEAARHVGHDRAELNAGAACLFATVELSEWSEAEAHAVRVMALAEKLGSSRFGHETLAFYGVVLHATGRTDDALDSIRQAIREARTLGLSFGGPRIFGRLICVTDDRDEQDAALAEAEEVIAQGCVGHNQPNFYRDAIEIMLGRRDWDEVHRYADSLAAFPQEESLPWSEFFVSRARALAAVETGTHDENTIARLQSLRDQALRIGLVAYLPSLETALGIDNPPIRAETSTR